ncbi:MAG: ABC transporter permease [Planctomycetia bacterium]|nr:ABC transporter permease [Planctomycetia bacterium]
MRKIFKYSFFDLIRSRWSITYFLFYFVISITLFSFSGDLSMVIISLMNIVLIIVPLVATVFGITYYYNSREFTELLLAQPIKRSNIFLGQYLGVATSLSLGSVLGIGIPFIIYGIFGSSEVFNFFILIIASGFLNFIFVAFAFIIAMKNNNKIKGFGFATLLWLFMAIIYDGLFLLLLVIFNDYPLQKVALGLTLLNPIDLSRILILLKLDISALMGYTGAVFNKFFGHIGGSLLSIVSLLLWVIIPTYLIVRIAKRKDF